MSIEVTKEQVKALKSTLMTTSKGGIMRAGVAIEEVMGLMTDQQLTTMLEQRGYFTGKWQEFNKHNESTYPPNKDVNCAVEYSTGSVEMEHAQDMLADFNQGYFGALDISIIKWCELPTPPKDK